MPRTLDPVLVEMLDRANPRVATFVTAQVPDTRLVLRRAADQFLLAAGSGGPLVSQSPASSVDADAAGALTIARAPAGETLFSSSITSGSHVDLSDVDASLELRGLAWEVDPAFGRAELQSFSAVIFRNTLIAGIQVPDDLSLQIYRPVGSPVVTRTSGTDDGHGHITQPITEPAIAWTFAPLLANPIVIPYASIVWSGDEATVTFDLSTAHVEVGGGHTPAPSLSQTGERGEYLFVLTAAHPKVKAYRWLRGTPTQTIAAVGGFSDRKWSRADASVATGWTETPSTEVPAATIVLKKYDATTAAVYQIDLPTAPIAASAGQVRFQRAVPDGTIALLELSTTGSGSGFAVVTDGSAIATKQQTYWLRATLDASTDLRRAPSVSALGIEFATPTDVSPESTIEPVVSQIDVPYLAAGIGDGHATIVRTGRRDYRDPGAELATSAPSSQLEFDVFLGSRHPRATREHWLQLGRYTGSDREPTGTSEQYTLLSYLKLTKQKIPALVETVSVVCVVASATTGQIQVTTTLPGLPAGISPYAAGGYYVRIRSSSQPNMNPGYLQTIDNSSGTDTLTFTAGPLPGVLVAGDVIEVHSGQFTQPTVSWVDADPADVWQDILTTYLGVPLERLGLAELGSSGRSGLPPKLANRTSDPATQNKLRVTLALSEQEDASDLLNQVSFLMGGATIEVAGQIVYRQIYPMRDAVGNVTGPTQPIAATFDVRNMRGLTTPSAVEQRIVTLGCTYGVNTASISGDTPPALTTYFADVDALNYLGLQDVDDLASLTIDDKICRWCYNSFDQGLYLASQLTQQVVRATSTGVRVWPWTATDPQPQLVVGDRAVVITDRYTDYDPSRQMAIRGWWAYTLVIVSVEGGGTSFRGFMLGLADAVQVKGGPGDLTTPPAGSGGGGSATVLPPTANLSFVSRNAATTPPQVTLALSGVAGDASHLDYRYRESNGTSMPAFGAYITSGADLPQSIAFDELPVRSKTVELQTRQADGQESDVASYVISPQIPPLDPTFGHPIRGFTFDDGGHAAVATDASGFNLHASVTDSGLRSVDGMFHKALDTADDIDDGSILRVTTHIEADGGGRAHVAIDAGNVVVSTGLDFARPYTGKILDNVPDGASRYAAAQVGADAGGIQILSNPDFAGASLAGYQVYDNNGTGLVTLSAVVDHAAPNSSGVVMQVSVAAGAAPTPGVGGFFVGIGPDAGAWAPDTYHEGATILWRVRANIPVGSNIEWAQNASGTGGMTQWLTSQAGTGAYQDYLFKFVAGTTGSFSTIGFFWLDTITRPGSWRVASCTATTISAPPGIVNLAHPHAGKTLANIGDDPTGNRHAATANQLTGGDNGFAGLNGFGVVTQHVPLAHIAPNVPAINPADGRVDTSQAMHGTTGTPVHTQHAVAILTDGPTVTQGAGRANAAIDSGNVVVTTGLDFSRGYTNKHLDNIPDGSSFVRTTPTEKTGAGRAAAAIDSSQSFYVPAGQDVNIGTQGSPSTNSKTQAWSSSAFGVDDSTKAARFDPTTGLRSFPGTTIGASVAFIFAIPVPLGAEMTAVHFTVRVASTESNFQNFNIVKVSSTGTATTIGTHSSTLPTGWGTVTISLSETIASGFQYFAVVALGNGGSGVPNNVGFSGFAVDYDISTYSQSL